jgi:hypothetical protein
VAIRDGASGALHEAAREIAHYFLRAHLTAYDRRTVKRSKPRSGPGLAKTRVYPLVDRRATTSFRSADYRWSELFEAADVMSEGAIRQETDGPAYYGTTSLLLPFVSRGGLVPDELATDVARLVARDVHARVRAVRIAYREARVRSVHMIGRIRAELVVRPDARGIRIDVDVDAKVVTTTVRAKRTRAR